MAPFVGTKGVAVFVFCDLNALDHNLSEIGESAGGSRREVAANGCGQEKAKGGVEITGRKIVAGEEMGDFAANFLGSVGLSFLVGMEATEIRMAGLARSTAAAAVSEGERTQGRTVLPAKGRHGILLKVGF